MSPEGAKLFNELLRPFPNQRQRVVYRRNAPPTS
jgi:hypothetical protein